MMELLELMKHRRAIRRFAPRQIEEEALQEILEAGLYAPSAGGRQGVIFAVCQNQEVNQRLGKIMYFFTAKGKDFCRQLLSDGRVQILGYTKYKEMIRLAATAKPAADQENRR